MAQKKAPRRTRERILDAALALFNRLGEPHVTTAVIADELNISPGNLYYHFRNKDEIIGDLYAAFEADVAPLLVAPADRAPQVDDLWFLLHLLFERMWAYRFLYRDLDEITSRNRRIASRFGALTRRAEATFGALAERLVAAGAMKASAIERRALARNIALVATYWMSFQRIGRVADRFGADDVERLDPAGAAWQVLALVAPFLQGDARRLVEQLGADYL